MPLVAAEGPRPGPGPAEAHPQAQHSECPTLSTRQGGSAQEAEAAGGGGRVHVPRCECVYESQVFVYARVGTHGYTYIDTTMRVYAAEANSKSFWDLCEINVR